mmetsp:Transcript_13450/g.29605  ORF Transcript_13450/g.29605 Transcript_13450/m.29605 type:complete len:219 (-) Transcript_13450:860-1516(-)
MPGSIRPVILRRGSRPPPEYTMVVPLLLLTTTWHDPRCSRIVLPQITSLLPVQPFHSPSCPRNLAIRHHSNNSNNNNTIHHRPPSDIRLLDHLRHHQRKSPPAPYPLRRKPQKPSVHYGCSSLLVPTPRGRGAANSPPRVKRCCDSPRCHPNNNNNNASSSNKSRHFKICIRPPPLSRCCNPAKRHPNNNKWQSKIFPFHPLPCTTWNQLAFPIATRT